MVIPALVETSTDFSSPDFVGFVDFVDFRFFGRGSAGGTPSSERGRTTCNWPPKKLMVNELIIYEGGHFDSNSHNALGHWFQWKKMSHWMSLA
jgi:hypothetical protein